MHAINTGKQTQDGLTVYDLDPQASELWAVAGPDGIEPRTIDPDNLPEGFRWVESEEWESLTPPIQLKGKPVHRIDVWWDTDSGRDNEGWAIHVYGDEKSELYSGGISADEDDDLDSVIDQGLWEAGIEGLAHDDFAKIKDNGGSAQWVPNQ